MYAQSDLTPENFDDYFRFDLPRLIRFTVRLGASLPEAEDVAQQAMLDVFRHWDDVTAPAAYTRTAATRIYLRGRKNAKREHEAVQRSWIQETKELAFDGDVQYVMNMLAGLPTDQREIMAWAIDGYGPSEIAELTGRTAATVRSQLRHARRKLAQTIAQRNHEPTRKEDGDG
ncbi:RNA polymerase sigma factor [Actinoallomurus iriomotensis]|uniref:HTH luxR-type domain-containing protein n=1 Tax=Actinoallomurus iriomotensis TaxID=478107 RepID=A0A9W6RPH6_9ACTN|nr:RNA polymerase sigma factor [Actinoallomurus iriomotensis]GLY80066.1 hypothetical protein Airi01_083330 [Actinoallomurus iriomotensis]